MRWPDSPPRSVRSLPERFQSAQTVIGRVRFTLTGHRPASDPAFSAKFMTGVSVRHLWPDACPAHLVIDTVQRLVVHRDRAFTATLTERWGLSLVTLKAVSGHPGIGPPLHQLLHPYSNVLTTKCITLCTCVSMFSQTFLRVLALTRI
jgi:hypothetical protein